MKTLAIVGPDGSGKTTFAKTLDFPRYHAIPITSRLPLAANKWARLVHEVVMGIEKSLRSMFLTYKAARLPDSEMWILDRCPLLDAESYSVFWSIKTKSVRPLQIAIPFQLFAYQPDEVWQFCPDPRMARPKRAYTPEDIGMLNIIYDDVIKLNGYYECNMAPTGYTFGYITVWRRMQSPPSLREKYDYYVSKYHLRQG